MTFHDDDGIDESSLSSGDVRVSGPFDGETRTKSVTLDDIESLGDGRFRATYTLTSPGGWTAADNGIYTIRLVNGEVKDTNGAAASGSVLGTFDVRIA